MMKTSHVFAITLLCIALVIAFVTATFNRSPASALNTSESSIFLQTTPTPAQEDLSEIGSTDGILIMGIVIVLIVTLPLLFYKKK
ncbi:MAG: hypothetical protein H7Y59_02710 [Anaerolineales bacterium]|nr:hypothetical protein [Anaerolineales bacterium]